MQCFKVVDNIFENIVSTKQRHYLPAAEVFCTFVDFYTINQKSCFFAHT